MNRIEPLTDASIEVAFERRARLGSVDGLEAQILAVTRSTRQRSTWNLRLGQLRPRAVSAPAWIVVAVLVALLGVLLALTLVGHRAPAPLPTGLLAYVSGGDVYLARPDGSDAEVVLHQDGVAFLTVAWSSNGGQLVVDGESGAVVIDSASGAANFIGGTNPIWSPDGRQLAVLDGSPGDASGTGTDLRIVDAATGTAIRTFPVPAIGGLAWSPNGRWIAATGGTNGGESNSLVRIDVATGEMTELDGPSGMLDSGREPAWSPDSLHIAFIRWGSENLPGCTGGDPLCESDVFVANADGSQPFRLNEESGKADQPSWSPDGRWIAFRRIDRSAQQGRTSAAAATGIVIASPAGSVQQTIVVDGVETFAWSPQSDRLRLISGTALGSGQTITAVAVGGAAPTVAVQIGAAANSSGRTGTQFDWQPLGGRTDVPGLPSVAPPTSSAALAAVTPGPADPADPSGTWPALVSQTDGGCTPVTIASGTGAVTPVANACGVLTQVSTTYGWSPDGSVYAVVIDQNGLTLVRRDGRVNSNVDQLTGLNGVVWSPDGRWLGALGSRNYVLRPDGSALREIPGDPTWSPDGHTLAVPGPDGQLLVGGADASDLHSVGSFPSPISWSPDGSRFAFIRDGNAWTAAQDGTDQRNLTSLPVGGALMVAWSADGRWISVAATHGVWLVPADGGPRGWLGLGLDETVLSVNWAPASERLALETYSTSTAGAQQAFVYIIDPSGAPTVRIDSARAPAWSPDGRFLLVLHASDGDATDGLLELMNSDGSGRRQLAAPAGLEPTIWAR